MNAKTITIPEAPTDYYIVPEKAREQLTKWINYFNNLSPRIWVRESFSKECVSRLESNAKLFCCPDYGKIIDWPEYENIIFIVYINSSIKNEKEFFTRNDNKDIYIFCNNNIAFSIDHFERDERGDNSNYEEEDTYSLSEFSDEMLSWEHIALIVKDSLGKI